MNSNFYNIKIDGPDMCFSINIINATDLILVKKVMDKVERDLNGKEINAIPGDSLEVVLNDIRRVSDNQ